jgi:DNA (cytosine-5)-methyltransferase 1
MFGLVLSLFPGADLLGMAFEQEGYCVVRGPDVLLGSDIRNWNAIAGKFDGIIGGPPCKSFSVAIQSRGGGEAALEGNLIPEFVRIVEQANPKWFLMENVPQAPVPEIAKWNDVFDAWDFGAAQHRKRRFSSNLNLNVVKCPEDQRHPDPFPCITATEYKVSPGSSERTMRQRAGRKLGRKLTIQEMNYGMGLPDNYDTPCLTKYYQYMVRGNGVPLQMGRALAKAIREASVLKSLVVKISDK